VAAVAAVEQKQQVLAIGTATNNNIKATLEKEMIPVGPPATHTCATAAGAAVSAAPRGPLAAEAARGTG